MESFYWQQLLREADIVKDSGRPDGLRSRKSWEPGSDGPLFVQLHSRAWNHQQFDSLIGKVVRITVEVVDG